MKSINRIISELKKNKTESLPTSINKQKNNLKWTRQILERKGNLSDPNICGCNYSQIVGPEIKKIGNMYAFKSVGCSGCLGSIIQSANKQALVTSKKIIPQCFLIENNWFLTKKEIVTGETIFMLKQNDKNPKLKKGWKEGAIISKEISSILK